MVCPSSNLRPSQVEFEVVSRIYLDAAATTPLSAGVAEAMAPWLGSEFGNPSSLYAEGRRARSAIDEARETLSRSVHCEFGEALFTSSGTEACAMAILGTAIANLGGSRDTFVFSAVEHSCVLDQRENLEKLGYRVLLAPVDAQGKLDFPALKGLLEDGRVLLLAVMSVNNETGCHQLTGEARGLAQYFGTLFLCDHVQAFGPGSMDFHKAEFDFLAVSAHKIGGPKGIGALIQKAGVKIAPIFPGSQERESRAGTENVAGIVGFGAAVKAHLADANGAQRKRAARDAFRAHLESAADPPHFTGDPSWTADGFCHLRFPGASAESMLIRLDSMGVSASSGAACSSGSIEPSHVLRAMGWSEAEAKEGLRFTFGSYSTVDEAERAAKLVHAAAEAIRG